MTIASTEFDGLQYADIYPDGIDRHYWTLARNAAVHRTLLEGFARTGDESAAKPLSGLSVLDVGCGRGLTVDYLRRRGIEAWGVELGESRPTGEAAAYVRTRTDARELPEEFRAKVGCLLLLDVLEHVPDPVGFLNELRAAMPNLRRMVVTVPARQELWSNYDEYNNHFKRYDARALRFELEACGGRVRVVRYLFRALYAPAWLMKRVGVRRSTRIQPPAGFSVWIHRAVAWLFMLESWALPASLPGSSLIAVASFEPPSRAPDFAPGSAPDESNGKEGLA